MARRLSLLRIGSTGAAGTAVLMVVGACVGDDPTAQSPNPLSEASVQPEGAAPEAAGPADCSVLYVLSGSAQSNDGCTKQTPLPTIAAAIGLVKAKGLPTKEIHVCQGTYAEPGLLLDVPVSLRGGYNCQTWERDPAYVYPTLRGAYETSITNGAYPRAEATLAVAGASVNDTVVIDGFTISAGATDAQPGTSSAVEVREGAAPKIVDVVLIGGRTTAGGAGNATFGSITLKYASAGGELFHSIVRGGSSALTGIQGGTGTVGVFVDGPTASKGPWIHENTIDGGSGSVSGVATGRGSVGVQIHGTTMSSASGNPFEKNIVRGGSGKTVETGSQALGSTGVWIWREAVIDVMGSDIDAGTGAVAGANFGGYAVLLHRASVSGARLIGNRLAGSRSTGPAYTGTLYIYGGTPVEVTNNLIVGGSSEVLGRAVYLGISTTTSFRHNTIVAPYITSASSDLLSHVFVLEGAREMQLQNNILVGHPSNDAAFSDVECPSTKHMSAVENNLFIGFNQLLTFHGGTCFGQNFSTVSAFEGALKSHSLRASGNHRLERPATCTADSVGCIPAAECETSVHACASTVFAAYTPYLNDAAQVASLMNGGLKLTTAGTLPCAAATGGLNLTVNGGGFSKSDAGLPPVGTDHYGAPRTPSPGGVSRGAHEIDGVTCR